MLICSGLGTALGMSAYKREPCTWPRLIDTHATSAQSAIGNFTNVSGGIMSRDIKTSPTFAKNSEENSPVLKNSKKINNLIRTGMRRDTKISNKSKTKMGHQHAPAASALINTLTKKSKSK